MKSRGPAVLVHARVIGSIGDVSPASLLAAVKQAAPNGARVQSSGTRDVSEED
ncbi:hypothetical protein [Corallococcus macrosporus]|uniref:Uncharacterized protein n=1 Tax=Corallococcus macrosporus DSM 14697 TaxID=1189310 RepID=A0A250JZH3_9BACT|nr:hypothetical protein [Corallococcus macrosporus]ATB49235.1 hypothetical protein MYMAC_004876 [Corallococcus macrosporus DSM 14697]